MKIFGWNCSRNWFQMHKDFPALSGKTGKCVSVSYGDWTLDKFVAHTPGSTSTNLVIFFCQHTKSKSQYQMDPDRFYHGDPLPSKVDHSFVQLGLEYETLYLFCFWFTFAQETRSQKPETFCLMKSIVNDLIQ